MNTPSAYSGGTAIAIDGSGVVAAGTASSSWVDLATVGPQATVTVGSKGKLFVMEASGAYAKATQLCGLSFSLSGANTLSADNANACYAATTTDNYAFLLRQEYQVSGLAAGPTTVTAKYSGTAGGEQGFYHRSMIVIAV